MKLSPETIEELKTLPNSLTLKVTDSLYERGFKNGYNVLLKCLQGEKEND
jgi:hypothetical protein